MFIQWLFISIIYSTYQPKNLRDQKPKNTPSRKDLPVQKPQKPFRYLIVRLLSNDLPPLHSENQTFLNTKFIIENEKLPENFYRLWIFHSIIDGEKLRTITKLLNEYGEWYFTNQIDMSLKLRGLYKGGVQPSINIEVMKENISSVFCFKTMLL